MVSSEWTSLMLSGIKLSKNLKFFVKKMKKKQKKLLKLLKIYDIITNVKYVGVKTDKKKGEEL